MNGTPRAYLDLVRAPNLFTAAADVLAGYLYTGGGLERWDQLTGLVVSSALLYAGGASLNDACDVKRDSVERPDRPIPSGRVSRFAALRLAMSLLVGGLGSAALTSTRAAVIAGSLIVAIVSYDAVLKSTPVAPVVMGLCRSLNLALGMQAAQSIWTTEALAPIVLMWLYITSVTFFARCEAGISSAKRLVIGTIGVCIAAAGLSTLAWIIPMVEFSFLGPVGILLIMFAYNGFRAASQRSPQSVQAAVRVFVILLVLFDACIAWAARGPIIALLVAVLILPALLCARVLRVT